MKTQIEAAREWIRTSIVDGDQIADSLSPLQICAIVEHDYTGNGDDDGWLGLVADLASPDGIEG